MYMNTKNLPYIGCNTLPRGSNEHPLAPPPGTNHLPYQKPLVGKLNPPH